MERLTARVILEIELAMLLERIPEMEKSVAARRAMLEAAEEELAKSRATALDIQETLARLS